MLQNRITKVHIKNFRSLRDVTVELDDLTVLVGPNGSGKSNFLDALRFVQESIGIGLGYALEARGGVSQVSYRTPSGQLEDIDITLYLSWYDNETKTEQESSLTYHVGASRDGQLLDDSLVEWETGGEDRHKRSTVAFVRRFVFYHPLPDVMRPPQPVGNDYPLDVKGKNIATVLRELKHSDDVSSGNSIQAINRALSAIVPTIKAEDAIHVQQAGSYYLFVELVHENGAVFDLASESDGTLRVLGILTALYQTPALPLMGFEELEMMVHPKALATLAEVIVEASTRGQVIVTTHSPDLISQFDPRTLRLVKMGENGTEIAPISAWNIEAVNDELFSTGDLLRIRALES